jgi:transcriptional regulator with PAS, ATPase and Fis domain
LDEIGDAPRSIQIKLRRAIQEKEILRVGGDKAIPVDVRIIAATNQDLIDLQRQGLFRQDLYYRLNALPLPIPPLRRRTDDIELLFIHLMNRAMQRQQKTAGQLQIMPEVIAMLERHSWLGNVREMENMVAYLLSIDASGKDQVAAVRELLAASEGVSGVPEAHLKGQEQNKSLYPMACQFPSHRMKEDCEAILRAMLAAKSGKMELIGRGDLQQRLRQENGLILSLDQIKLRLNILRSFGYVEAKMGKGHYLLPAGYAYLANN